MVALRVKNTHDAGYSIDLSYKNVHNYVLLFAGMNFGLFNKTLEPFKNKWQKKRIT